MGDPLDELTCRDCGRRIGRHGRTGLLIHRSGGAIAACDLDSDHPPRVDWSAVDAVRCGVCGEPAQAVAGGRLGHVDAGRDDDHAADPWGRARDD